MVAGCVGRQSPSPPTSVRTRVGADAGGEPVKGQTVISEEKFADVGVCASTGVPIRICYQTFGRPDAAGGAVLLVMGLISPSLLWDGKFCACLAARGYYVIRYDNRDIGRSTFLTSQNVASSSTTTTKGTASYASFSSSSTAAAAAPGVMDEGEDEGEVWEGGPRVAPLRRSWFGLLDSAPALYARLAYVSLVPGRHRIFREAYTLQDMAKDAVGLLDALHIARAHVVGMCMGGMIAQIMAFRYPARVASLALMSTHSSSPQTVWPSLREGLALANSAAQVARNGFAVPLSLRGRNGRAQPSRQDEDALVQMLVSLFERFAGGAGSAYPIDCEACERQLRRIVRRSSDFSGAVRQYVALLNAPSRVPELRRLHVPTTVLHGTNDPIVPYANGQQLAGIIPNAKLVTFCGLGHTLHPALRQRIVTALVRNMQLSKATKAEHVGDAKL
ncbi:hydrolase-like protein [Trypanosoma grayi]|uniref:hydrolase-like protein n=1 Tax=Trypanosoma grayi TaxID=71804 RepID=UPI0004F40FC4|nr:hydrolase-like protein [Trypanosoma grayi]KEG06209.1 hydrolase-like protein [Trypanosoma grayi]